MFEELSEGLLASSTVEAERPYGVFFDQIFPNCKFYSLSGSGSGLGPDSAQAWIRILILKIWIVTLHSVVFIIVSFYRRVSERKFKVGLLICIN
jgi:hypothetical protein